MTDEQYMGEKDTDTQDNKISFGSALN